MIYLSTVPNFKLHRVIKNVYVHSLNKNMKTGMLVNVLTPTLKENLEYYNEMEKTFLLRFNERICVEKLTKLMLFPSTKYREFNTPSLITDNLPQHRGLNLSTIKKFIVYNEQLGKSTELKNFNTIYEYGHVVEKILNNPRDKRHHIKKIPGFINILKTYLQDKLSSPIFENHTSKYLFIPINKWIDFKYYKKSAYFKDTTPNWFVMFVLYLRRNPDAFEALFKGWTKIILTNLNEFMVLDVEKMIEDRKSGLNELKSFDRYIVDFMKLCKSKPDALFEENEEETATEVKAILAPINKENISQEEMIQSKMEEAKNEDKEYRSKVDTEIEIINTTEKVLENIGISVDEVSSKDLDEIRKNIEENEELTNAIKNKEEIDPSKIKDISKMIQVKMNDMSPASIQRNRLLAEKYKEKKLIKAKGSSVDINYNIDDKTEVNLDIVTVSGSFVNESVKNVKSEKIVEQYMDEYYYKHLLKMLHHFGKCDPPQFMIDNLIEEDVSDSMNRVYLYTAKFEDNNRKRSTMSFLLPKMYQERHLFLNGAKKDLIFQKFPYPITKLSPTKAQVVTNDKKIFVERYGTNISPKVTRLIKFLNNGTYKGINIQKGDLTQANKKYMLPLEFTELAANISSITSKDLKFVFNLNVANMEFPSYSNDKKENEIFIPFGKNISTSKIYYLNLNNEMVYLGNKNLEFGIADLIINSLLLTNDKLIEEYNNTSVGNKFVYSRATIMAHNIPTIILLASINKFGLLEVLKRAKVNYEIQQKRPQINPDKQGVFKFADAYLVYDRYPYYNSLLVEGLYAINTKEYTISDMYKRSTYENIYEEMFNKRNLINALENFNQTFVDPITIEIQNKLDGPTDFEGMVLMASDSLADNNYKLESSYEQTRIRGPEIILAYLYQNLSAAYGRYRMNPKANSFTMPKDCVIKDLMKSESMDEHTSANIMLELENNRRVKSKGPSGLNEDRAYTLDKRAFHPSMRGLVALSTNVSAEVGITRELTVNANITDPMGFVNIKKDESQLDGSEILSTSEMLNTFSIESADANRSMMTTGQSKHMIIVEDMSEPIISTDFERVAPYLSKDYAKTARYDGEITAIENDMMFIKYKNGEIDDIHLGSEVMKHTNAGKYHVEKLETELKPGSKVKAGQIVAYNPHHFKRDMFGDLVTKTGTLSRVAFVASGSVHEDSTYITNSLAQRLKSKTTMKKEVVTNIHSNIKKYLKVGDKVEVNDYLLVFDRVEDEFTSKLLANIEEKFDEDFEIQFGTTPLKSKYPGVIKDIKVYYTCDFKQLTPSMQKFIEDVTSESNNKIKSISKFKSILDAYTMLSANEKTETDSLGRVKGVPIGDGVMIEYYVEYIDIMAVGDKLTFCSAIKGTVNQVIDDEYAAFTDLDDQNVEAFVSIIGSQKRMVLDIFKIGIGNKILIEEKKKFIKLFGDEINNYKS